jgi:GH43 family beta-xylosidase
LGDHETTCFPHGCQADAAVGTHAGENDADGARSVLVSHRVQQKIERQARAVASQRLRQAERPVPDRKRNSGRNNVQMFALDLHPIFRLLHAYRRVASQQVDHHAFMIRIEMLNQNKRHAGIDGECTEQLPAGVETACRCAYSDDGKVLGFQLRNVAGKAPRTGAGGELFSAMGKTFRHGRLP